MIITGGTGAIGSKVAKKLLKAGKKYWFSLSDYFYIGAKVVLIVKDPTKLDSALNITDPRIKSG